MQYFLESMRQYSTYPGVFWCIELIICSTLLMLCGWMVTRFPWSAAIKHRVWLLAFVGLVALPPALCMLPVFSLPVLPPIETTSEIEKANELGALIVGDLSLDSNSEAHHLNLQHRMASDLAAEKFEANLSTQDQRVASVTQTPSPTSPSKSEATPYSISLGLFSVWLIGFLALLTDLVFRISKARRWKKRSQEPSDSKWQSLIEDLSNSLGLEQKVSLYFFEDSVVPMTWGIYEPAIGLPLQAKSWTQQRKRTVLLHELSHIKRRDVLSQTACRLISCFYWFHPMAWYALMQLRLERELACDDCVIAAGEKPSDYAKQLVDIARQYKKDPAIGVAIASTSKLESRVQSMLDFARSHVPVTRKSSIVLLTCCAFAILSLATLRLGHRQWVAIANSETETVKTISGLVLDSNGTPIQNTTVELRYSWSNSYEQMPISKSIEEVKTDISGRFKFEITDQELKELEKKYAPEMALKSLVLIARSTGSGSDWREFPADDFRTPLKPITLNLVPASLPIEGRIVNLEGVPISGATITLTNIAYAKAGTDIGSWIERAKKNHQAFDDDLIYQADGQGNNIVYYPAHNGIATGEIGDVPKWKTDTEGRFEVQGLGDDRLATFNVSAPGKATLKFSVLIRNVDPLPTPHYSRAHSSRIWGCNFDLPLEQELVVEGEITDKDTGKPIPGVKIAAFDYGNDAWFLDGTGRAQTGEDGKYKLSGLARKPKRLQLDLRVANDLSYYSKKLQVPPPKDFAVQKFDIRLKTTRKIRGRLIDKVTNEPLQGQVIYYPYLSNKNAEQYELFKVGVGSIGMDRMVKTDKDGNFIVKVIDGEGVLCATVDNGGSYVVGHGAKELGIDPVASIDNRKVYHLHGSEIFNSLQKIDISSANLNQEVVIGVVPLKSSSIEVTNSNGNPASGLQVYGRYPASFVSRESGLSSNPDETFDSPIETFGVDTPRWLLVLDKGRSEGIASVIDSENRSSVRLEPCSNIRGKIVASNDWDKANALVSAVLLQVKDPSLESSRVIREHTISWAKPSKNGEFTLKDVIPGAKYEIRFRTGKTVKVLKTESRIESGRNIDLGEVDLDKPDRSFDPKKMPAKSVYKKLFSGSVTDENGRPIEDAMVAVFAVNEENEGRGEFLVEELSDSNGRFELDMVKFSMDSYSQAMMICRSESRAMEWKKVDLGRSYSDLKFQLQPEQVIRGRFVDIEGQPVANAKFQVKSVGRKDIHDYCYCFVKNPVKSWIPSSLSSEDGSFEVLGVAKDYGVSIKVEASDRIAPQTIALNTGMSETRGPRDGTYRPGVVNAEKGKLAVVTLEPAKEFKGVVTFADTGERAANVIVEVWASQREYGSMSNIRTTANDSGEFSITPEPGIWFGLKAFPPNDSPYLIPTAKRINWEDGSRSKTVNIELPRGVQVRGQVIDKTSKQPISNASVQYISESSNNEFDRGHVITGWQGLKKTDQNGDFSISVLPGKGRILVHAGYNVNYVHKVIGERRLFRGSPGGAKNYFHAIREIEPPETSDLVKIDPVELTPGAEVACRVVDENNQPIESFSIQTTLNIHPTYPEWKGGYAKFVGNQGQFKLKGMRPKKTYKVHVLDAKNRLGATLDVKAGDNPVFKLQPFGGAVFKLVDKNEQPLVELEPTMYFVMTDGPMSSLSSKMGLLSAEQDFVQNVDRLNNDDYQRTDKNGFIRFDSLVPGATYHLVEFNGGNPISIKKFVAQEGKTIDFGKVIVRVDSDDRETE